MAFAHCLQGGGVYILNDATVTFQSCGMRNNQGSQGSHLYIESASTASTIYNCTFDDSGGASAIVVNSAIDWICQLGRYMPPLGVFPGGFSGCLHLCPLAFYGNSPNLTAPTGDRGCQRTCHAQTTQTPFPHQRRLALLDAACMLGHYCPSPGTSSPLPCPVGTHMPAAGAANRSSCLPVYDQGAPHLLCASSHRRLPCAQCAVTKGDSHRVGFQTGS